MDAGEIRQARIALEGPIDYDAAKAIANRALTLLEQVLAARHSTGPSVRYEEDTLDRLFGVPRSTERAESGTACGNRSADA